MAYKHIDDLLNQLGYLSKPKLKETIVGFFDSLEAELDALSDKIHGKHLVTVVIGFQHGYSHRAVAEYIVDYLVNSVLLDVVLSSKIGSVADITPPVIDSMNLLSPVIVHSKNPFFKECDYQPSSDEVVRDPLDVINEINERRLARQNAVNNSDAINTFVNKSGGNVDYPTFGSWVDQSVRIHSEHEVNHIKDFRGAVQKEIQTIKQHWFE